MTKLYILQKNSNNILQLQTSISFKVENIKSGFMYYLCSKDTVLPKHQYTQPFLCSVLLIDGVSSHNAFAFYLD